MGKNKKIKFDFKNDIEPHEVLLDSLAKKREAELGLSEKKLEVPLLKKILQGLLIFSFILILILFGKTIQLQVVEGKNLSVLSEKNKFIIHQIQAERGVIYDKNLNQLVFNWPSFDLVCQNTDWENKNEEEKDKILKEISEITKKNFEELKQKIEEGEDLIVENLDHQTLIILETKIGELPGFRIEQNPIRYYPDGRTISHLIGYTGKIKSEELKAAPEFYTISDYIGRDGLEKSYEEILRKNPGKLKIERDAQGHIISKETIQLPESGKSLVLWLDSELQKKIQEELEKEIKIVGAKGGVAVALDPKTGGVLALVSYPSIDNNLFSKRISQEEWKEIEEDPLKPLFNRAIAGTYLTGSTIKPLIASAALEEKIISPEKKINAQGKILVQDQWNPEKIWEYKDWAVHGWTDIRKAIAQSVNVYFYTIGGGYGDQKGLGPTKIKEYLEKFGWNQKTGIDLPGEAEGFIPDKEWKKKTFPNDPGWWDGDTYNLSIGQGFLQITPLEVAASFVSIANGGKLLQPQVVKEIIDSKKNPIEEIKPKVIRENFIKPENLQIVREGMRQAVTSGSATGWLDQLRVPAAAKTGTAELGKEFYNNWVTVFAPYEDPQIVLTIIIENVKGVQTAALPVAKAVLEWYFAR
ncbi:MAG: penicillin-binding protein 2 [Parcubacteria group bacterium CG2_30_36_18]|nr:MAG: penicillin-binding protein 2 [Parcubacteria group bacterium CG2_30_36_18]